MAIVQSAILYDVSTFANQKSVAQALEAGITGVGWVPVLDPGTVNWANVSVLCAPTQGSISSGLALPVASSYAFLGVWVGGTAYTGTTSPNNPCSVVTSGGVTYICMVVTSAALTQVVPNTALSAVSTSVAVQSIGNTVYTVTLTGGATNGLVGYQFVCSGDSVNSANNGTFFCVASDATHVTLSNPNGVSHTVGGTFPTVASVNTVTGFIQNSSVASSFQPWSSNALVGYSMTSTGFAASAGVNNTSLTVTSSGFIVNSFAGYAGTFSGTAETHSGTATINTAPSSDVMSTLTFGATTIPIGHWVPFYYDIWRSNDLQNPTNPLSQVGTVGTVTTYTGTGLNYVVGEAVTIAGFANGVNNGTFPVQSVSGTTSFTVTTVNQAAGTNESHAATVYNCDNPMYMRFAYYSITGNTNPGINVWIGTLLGTAQGTGSIAGNVLNQGGAPPEFVLTTAQAGVQAGLECDFQSPDSGPFSLLFWRDGTTKTQSIVLDRARDQNGNTLNTYWLCGAVHTAAVNLVQVLFKNGTGGVVPATALASWPALVTGIKTWIYNNQIPACPIFPTPGYVANPCLQIMSFALTDVIEGSLISVIVYSQTHTYLVTKQNTSSFYGGNVGGAYGIRWE